jgi:hypothetical protein
MTDLSKFLPATVLISHDKNKMKLTAPDSLGKPFHVPH